MAIADKLTLIAENMQKVYDAGVAVIPEGYIKPSGSLDITENNTYDVKQYESVNVNVASSGGDLTINGVIEQYKVNAGATVNAGDFVEFVEKVGWGSGEFNTGTSNYISACKLSDTKVLVAYIDGGNSSYGTAVVLSLENGAVTVGTEFVFYSSAITNLCAIVLTDTSVLVGYSDSSTSSYVNILNINGLEITKGTQATLYSGENDIVSLAKLSDTKAIGIFSYDYWANSYTAYYYTYVKVIEINNGNLTVSNSTLIYNSLSNNRQFYAIPLNENKVLIANSNTQKVQIITIEGTTVTTGTEQVITDFWAPTSNGCGIKLTQNRVMLFVGLYSSYVGQESRSNMFLLGIEGGVITVLDKGKFADEYMQYVSATALSETKVLVTFSSYTEKTTQAIVLTLNNDIISIGEQMTMYNSQSDYISLVTLSNASALVFYNSSTGQYKSLNIDGTTITESSAGEAETFVQPATSRLYNVGVAKTGGTEGETVEVYCVEEPDHPPTPKQITVTFAGDSYMSVIHNDTTYYDASSFTAMTGDEIGFFNGTGSMYMALYVNGENIGELTAQETIYWTIPYEATSVNIAEGVYEYGYNNYDITYTTD